LDAGVEGVQSAAQVAALRRIGATVGQGFHFGQPQPADEFLELATQDWARRRPGKARSSLRRVGDS